MEIHRILVGLDGSPRSAAVLAAAVELAQARHGQLTLVRVVGVPAEMPQDFWKETDRPLVELLRDHARQYLAGCVASVAPELRAQPAVEVCVGSPWQMVCDTARRLGADLIVLGSHGYSGIDRILGTTAAKVVNHAPCSVLVVREAGTLVASPPSP